MFAAQYPGLQVWYTGYGWMLCEGDRHDEARAMIEAQGLRFETMEDGSLPLCGTHQLAAVAWELDDVEMAANLVPVLEKYVGRWSHYFLVPLGPVEWGLGAALSVLGETDRAVALVEEAVTKLVDNGFRDHAVHCRIHLARILLRADRPGDREHALGRYFSRREPTPTPSPLPGWSPRSTPCCRRRALAEHLAPQVLEAAEAVVVATYRVVEPAGDLGDIE